MKKIRLLLLLITLNIQAMQTQKKPIIEAQSIAILYNQFRSNRMKKNLKKLQYSIDSLTQSKLQDELKDLDLDDTLSIAQLIKGDSQKTITQCVQNYMDTYEKIIDTYQECTDEQQKENLEAEINFIENEIRSLTTQNLHVLSFINSPKNKGYKEDGEITATHFEIQTLITDIILVRLLEKAEITQHTPQTITQMIKEISKTEELSGTPIEQHTKEKLIKKIQTLLMCINKMNVMLYIFKKLTPEERSEYFNIEMLLNIAKSLKTNINKWLINQTIIQKIEDLVLNNNQSTKSGNLCKLLSQLTDEQNLTLLLSVPDNIQQFIVHYTNDECFTGLVDKTKKEKLKSLNALSTKLLKKCIKESLRPHYKKKLGPSIVKIIKARQTLKQIFRPKRTLYCHNR